MAAELSLNDRQRLVQTAIHEARGSTDCYIVELYDDRAIYETYGEGSDAGKTYEVPYTIADDQVVTLGDRREVIRETTFVPKPVKFTGADEIEGLGIPFSIDTDGETFTPKTDLCIEWFGKSGRPLLYDHGLDKPGAAAIGRQTDYEERTDGIWVQSQLKRNDRYRKAVDKLIDEGALGYSSGAMAHLAQKNRRNEITRWPWVENSLTPIPAHPGTLVHYVKSADALAHLAEVDIAIPDPLKAALAALDEWAETNSDAESLPDGLKVADLIDRLSVDGPAWVKARRDWYAKSGRVLSAATRDRLAAHPSALRQLADDLDELLSNADSDKTTKSVDLFAEWLATEERLARLDGIPIPLRNVQ